MHFAHPSGLGLLFESVVDVQIFNTPGKYLSSSFSPKV